MYNYSIDLKRWHKLQNNSQGTEKQNPLIFIKKKQQQINDTVKTDPKRKLLCMVHCLRYSITN